MSIMSVCIHVMKFMSEKGFMFLSVSELLTEEDKTDSVFKLCQLSDEMSRRLNVNMKLLLFVSVSELWGRKRKRGMCGGVFGCFLPCCVTFCRSERWSLSSSAQIKDRSVWGSVPALWNNTKITERSSLTFDLSALTNRNKSVQTHSSSDSSPGLTLTLNPHWDLQECFNIRFNPADSDLDCFSSGLILNQNPDMFEIRRSADKMHHIWL